MSGQSLLGNLTTIQRDLVEDSVLVIEPKRIGACPQSGGMRFGCCYVNVRRLLRVTVVGLAHHLDRSASALGEQHRAFSYVAVDLWGGLYETISADRMGAVERLL